MALVDDLRNKLTNVADAIREKNGGSDEIKMDDMPDAIRNIPTGGTTGSITKLQMVKITGLTSEIVITNTEEADYIIQTESTGGYDASVSINGTTYLFTSVNVTPAVIDDTLQLFYGSESSGWQLKALVSIRDIISGEEYTAGEIISSWLYNSSVNILLKKV